MVSAKFYLQQSTQEGQDNRSQKVNVRWRRVMTVLKVFESVGNNMQDLINSACIPSIFNHCLDIIVKLPCFYQTSINLLIVYDIY